MKKFTLGIIILCISTCLYYSFSPLLDEPGLTIPEPIGPFLNGNFPDISPSSQEYRPAFPNLTFDSPLTFTSIPPNPDPLIPNDNRLIVGQRNGKIYSFENNDNVTQKNLLRDMSNEVGVVWDGGFLGLAIHPEFGQSNKNYIYTYYTTKDSQGRDYPDAFVSGFSCAAENYWGSFLILKRMTVDPITLSVDPSKDVVMIKMRMFGSTHRGGALVFGNDGFLYLATGDQSAYAKAQNVTTNLDGGVLRIDVDQNTDNSYAPKRKLSDGRFPDEISGNGYGIPNDNPFTDSNGSRFEEYFTVGHRNPHRMTKDKLTGDFYIGEVGETRHEEINVIKKGRNYGWPVYEGNFYRSSTCTDLLDNMAQENPLTAFPRSDANALIGGYVYRGAAMPNYYGKYICADYGIGEEIWAVDIATGQYEVITQFSPTDIISFGEDNEGELYLLSQGDNVKLYKMVEGGELEGTVPQLLSETGAFTDLQNMEPEQGLIPYDLIESFWSDGAEKKRWLAIPNNGTHNTPAEQISFSENGDWQFPTGSILVKHFELPIDENNPTITKKLETRFSIKASNGSFYFLTYKWNDAETEAFLLESGMEEDIAINKADGSTGYQKWTFPSTQDCISCHNPATGGSLGTRTRYLNSELTYERSGVTSNQLVTLSHLGILNEIIDENKTQGYQTYKALNDAGASLDEKARSYLDLNCAYCHRPGATGERAQFDLQLFQSLSQTNLLNVGTNTPIGIDGEKILVPNDASKSILFHRMNTIDQTIAMPPIAKNKVDVAGVQLIEEWINQLQSPLPIPNTGDYRIVNKASGGTLQIPDAGLANSDNVAVGAYGALDNQHFAFEETGNGYYQFRALHSEKYIDVAMGATVPDTNVWQYVGNGTDAQLWELHEAGEGTFYIVSKLSGYYLGETPDDNVAVMANTGSNATQWEFLPLGQQTEIGIALQTTSVSTSENGDSADFKVRLKSAPVNDVILLLSGLDNTDEYTLSLTELSFTATNWEVYQTVTVTGIDDADSDGSQNYTINITVDESRSDTSYFGTSATVNGVNLDNDGTCNGTLADVSEPVGSGTITSRNDFVPTEDRFKAFDNRRTKTDHSKWLDGAGTPTTTSPSWIQLELLAPKRVEAITITSANDDYGRDPKDFRLMASNGGDFTEVGSWSSQEFTLRYQTKTFNLSAPGNYTIYKLEITKNDEDVALTQIAEIELLGCEPDTTVPVQVTDVELAPESLEMVVDTTVELQASVLPVDATDKTLIWSSENPAIATVDNTGKVTAKATGNTMIIVTTNDGGFTASTTLTVEENGTTNGTCNGTLADVSEPVGSGTITSRNDFVPTEDRFKAFDNRRTKADHSKWLDGAGIPTTTSPSWIQLELVAPKRVEAITITSANDDYGRDPKDFRLMASNGGDFTEVGSWSSQEFTLRYQTKTFNLSAPGTYTTYKLEITKNDEDVALTQIAEIELLGCEPPLSGSEQVTDVEITPQSLQMEIGATVELSATVLPTDATNKTVVWTSEDPSIATVDNIGNVSAHNIGTTVITVTTTDGGFMATATVTIEEPVSSDIQVTDVNLSDTLLQMEIGATVQLLPTVLPTDATDKTIVWTSEDPSIATVDNNGNVSAQGLGNTVITVTTNDGGFTSTASVTVEDNGTTNSNCNGTLADVSEPVGSGTITSRNDFVPAEDRFKAFDNRSTRGNHSKWLDGGGVPTLTNPSWIQLELPAPKRVEVITITSANDDYGRDPKDFRLMASNGGDFTEVGNWIGQEFSQRYQSKSFELSAPGTYTTYRLEVTKNDEDVALTQLAEIELMGCEPQTSNPVQVADVELSPTSLQMKVGATVQLQANILPANATNKNVGWSSADPTIVMVDNSGNVTAMATGNTLITVSTNQGGYTATSTITVEEDTNNNGTCNGTLADVADPVGSGTITSRNDFIPAEDRFKAFDNKTERGNFSKWLDASGVPTALAPSWIQIVLELPKRVEAITITSANDDYGRDPKDFRLMGSNGGAFTELGSWSGQAFTQRYQSKTFDLASPGTYTIYKLEITKNDENVELTQLAEIELLGCDTGEPTSISVTSKLVSENVFSPKDSFTFSPNPVGEDRYITLQLTSHLMDTEVTVAIYSMEGKLVYSRLFWNEQGSISYELQLNQSLPSGIYLMEVRNTHNVVFRKKLILK